MTSPFDHNSSSMPPQAGEGRFFLYATLLLAVLALAGFGPSYYFRAAATAPPPLTTLMHLHGLAFSLWTLVLVAQALLVARQRVDLHRTLGIAGAGVALLTMLLAAALAYERTLTWLADPSFSSYDVLAFLLTPVTTIVFFSGMVTAALLYRHRPAIHKRLMLLACLDVFTPAVSRLPLMSTSSTTWHYAAIDLFIVALLIHDWRTQRRVHTATLVGGALLVASQVGRELLAWSDTWLDLAIWLTGS